MPVVMRLERGPFRVLVVPVLTDNFVYVVCRDQDAVLVDAGQVEPVEAVLAEEQLVLRQVLVTHAHGDHTAGLARLRAQVQPGGLLPGPVEKLALPGHTPDDVGFYYPSIGVVFTGDCLINGACGRVITGSMRDLYESLQHLKALPPDTLMLGGHDYLPDNLQFARDQEPHNAAIQERLAHYAQEPYAGLFLSLAEEMRTNPFLQAADLETFAALRRAKDRF